MLPWAKAEPHISVMAAVATRIFFIWLPSVSELTLRQRRTIKLRSSEAVGTMQIFFGNF